MAARQPICGTITHDPTRHTEADIAIPTPDDPADLGLLVYRLYGGEIQDVQLSYDGHIYAAKAYFDRPAFRQDLDRITAHVVITEIGECIDAASQTPQE